MGDLYEWCVKDPTTFYFPDLLPCVTHGRLSEVPYTGTQHDALDECGVCLRRSVLTHLYTGGDVEIARSRWCAVHEEEKKRRETDLDHYEEYGKEREYQCRDLERLERKEMQMWMEYMCTVWLVNKQRITQFKASQSGSGVPTPPNETKELKLFMRDMQDRQLIRNSQHKRTKRVVMYCFEHGVLGDFVMHRRTAAYRECGVCVNSATHQSIQKSAITDTEDQPSANANASSSNYRTGYTADTESTKRGTKNKSVNSRDF